MSSSEINAMDQDEAKPFTECQQHIRESATLLREVLSKIEGATNHYSDVERESLDADVCLASRSAYFDFYTWLVLHDQVDEAAEQELDELFRRSLDVLRPGPFRDSVNSRYKEFRSKCRRVRDGAYTSILSNG